MVLEDFNKAKEILNDIELVKYKISNVERGIDYLKERIEEKHKKRDGSDAEIEVRFSFVDGWENPTTSLYISNNAWQEILDMLNSRLETYQNHLEKLEKEFVNL